MLLAKILAFFAHLLRKPVLEKPNTTFGESESLGLLRQRARGVNAPSSEPQTKGLQNFYTQTGLSEFVGLQGPGDCKEPDKDEWDKL